MKICLAMVYNGNPFEALGIEALATYVQNFGYDVDLKMINSFKIKNSDILQLFKESYLFVGFSVSYANINDTYQLCKIIKENQNSKIFVGSQYATLNAKEILKDCEYIDFVICGEGELVLKNILDSYKIDTDINFIGELDGVLTREKNEYSIATIDENLFIPIKHTLLGEKTFQNVLMARIYSSRGCCANCSFCTHNCYNTSKTWRGRSVKEVFDEMVDVHQKYGISVFMFNDSSIEDPGFLGKARLEELCEHMLKYEDELYVFCYIRAETFSEKDDRLLEKMHRAGIVSLFVGIESANEKDLKLYNKIANVQQNEQAMQLFKKKGFRIMPGFIMFNPLSDTDTLYSNFMFCKKHELYLSCYYESQLAIFKGAKIESHIREKNLLDNEFSYKNPYAYEFQNTKVNDMFNAIQYQKQQATFYESEKDFEFFEPLYSAAINIYNRKNKVKEKNVFEPLKKELFSVMIKHFELLFTGDIDGFRKDIPHFDDAMNIIYKKYGKMKSEAYLSKPFIQLIRGRNKYFNNEASFS